MRLARQPLVVIALTFGIALLTRGGRPARAADPPAVPGSAATTLADARRDFKTKLVGGARDASAGDPADVPPAEVFQLVKYPSAVGPLDAYVTADPHDGARHPAIVWVHGGDCNSIGDVWTPHPESNDQTAAAYRQAGVVMMFPSLRGGDRNPGAAEGFYGEVDDVLAAADFLAKQPQVDPRRIYLGGHSTGGTLALLVAECSDRFRAVFSFGPVADVTHYGRGIVPLPFDHADPREVELRAPGRWLASIKGPTFVFEGAGRPSNAADVRRMARQNASPAAHFFLVNGASHFSILAPANRLIAGKILRDDGPTTKLAFTDEEIAAIGRRTPAGPGARSPRQSAPEPAPPVR